MTIAYFSGPAKWARLLKPDDKYNKYSISVGLDVKQLKELQALKVKNGSKIGDDGLFWVNFHRKASDGAPILVDNAGMPLSDLVGNGSEATVKCEVYSWTAKDGSTQHGIKMVGVQVSKLVIYDPDKKEEKVGMPDRSSTNPAPSSSNLKPRIPF